MTAATIGDRRRLAQGREAEIFEWEPGTVLKLYRAPEWAQSAATERAAMMAVHAAGGPAPAAGALLEIDGRPALVMERIAGIDLLTQVGRKPWTVFRAGDVLGRAHAALHASAAPAKLRRLRDVLPQRIAGSPLVPDALKPRALEALAALPDGERVCHGDYHPGNVMVSEGRAVVIDWPGAVAGPPEADIARTELLLRLGEPPPGAPLLVRTLTAFGRKVLTWRYRRAYRAVVPYDEALVLRWMLPLAIARLGENIPEERERTLALIDTLAAEAS